MGSEVAQELDRELFISEAQFKNISREKAPKFYKIKIEENDRNYQVTKIANQINTAN